MKNITRIAIAAAGVAALALTACSDHTELDDAPVGVVDDTPQFVMTNLDSYPNVAFRCFIGPDIADGGIPTGVYTTTRDTDNLKLVINDPQCPGYQSAVPTVVTR